jgi:flavin-dependent dehydrogenase
LEKAVFPRDKVCGDCVNPGCWPLFQQLGVARTLLASPHQSISCVAFIGPQSGKSRRVDFPLDSGQPGEIAIPRRILDAVLLQRSEQTGAHVRHDTPLHSLSRDTALWRLQTADHSFTARRLIAADGRNSTVARLLGAAPAARRGRVALQAHIPTPPGQTPGIELHLFPQGYCGVAPVGEGLTNLCLVATPARLDALKAAVSARFAIPPGQQWRAIAPLDRAPIHPLRDGVLYIGDAARVVEPFTGEGIYYALHSGALAARHLLAGTSDQYPAAHAALYRRRLWINRLARWAVTHPGAGAMLLRLMTAHPASLQYLVQRVNAPQEIPV